MCRKIDSRLFRREFFLGSPRDTVYPWGLWSPFYSALNIVFGSPRDTVYPWGIWSPFYSALNVIIGVFKRYLRFRGVCSCVFFNIVI